MNDKQKMDTACLPLAFYAHMLQFTGRESSDNRCRILLEAVVKDKIGMFLTGQLPEPVPANVRETGYFTSAWESFRQGGLESPDFITKKAVYLADASNGQIVLMYRSFKEAMAVAEADHDWWEIVIYPAQKDTADADACMFEMTGYEAAEGEYPFTIQPVSGEEEAMLYHLYTYFGKQGYGETDTGPVGMIRQGTSFQNIQVAYTGTGLCCVLMDVRGFVAGFFDMGIESLFSNRVLANRNQLNYTVMDAASNSIYAQVLNLVQNTPYLTVIVSHWHTDHEQILNDIAYKYVHQHQNIYANFWQTVSLVCPAIRNVPGWACTHYASVQGALTLAQNHQAVICPYLNANQNIIVSQGQNYCIYKCDRNDANIRKPDPHDHGLSMVIRLQSGSTVLLPGDCAYDTMAAGNPASSVITNNNQGYTYLVASHHGGKYTHMTGAGKLNFIPHPAQAGQEIIYSANGAAYGIPTAVNVRDYRGAGWQPVFLQNIPMQGFDHWIMI